MKKESKWKDRMISAAKFYATWSKDDSTKVGAVTMIEEGDDGTILTTGFNGFPRGVDDDVEERKQRPLKYKFCVHAEANAIYNAAKHGIRLEGSSMYSTFFPCSTCAQGIVQSGIKKIYASKIDFKNSRDKRWEEDIKISRQILYEGSVEVEFF